jgi:hypothetical protein
VFSYSIRPSSSTTCQHITKKGRESRESNSTNATRQWGLQGLQGLQLDIRPVVVNVPVSPFHQPGVSWHQKRDSSDDHTTLY